MPWNVIDEETVSFQCDKHISREELPILTPYETQGLVSMNSIVVRNHYKLIHPESPNKLNLSRRSQRFHRQHGKKQHNISFARSPDNSGDTHVRKTPFERYQRGPRSPP